MQVIFQAGGKGTRLRPLTNNKPKCFLKIKNKPIFYYQYKYLKKYNLHKDLLIISNDRHTKYFKNFFKHKKNKVTIVEETPGLGSAGSLKENYKYLKKNFIYIYNDIFFNVNFKNFINFKKNHIKIFCHKSSHLKDSDTIIFDKNYKISKIFLKKKKLNFKSTTSMSGIFFLKKNLFRENNKIRSLTDVFQKILKKQNIFCYYSNEFFQDFGTHNRLVELRKNISKLEKKISIIFDRDGTIINNVKKITNLKKDVKFVSGFLFFLKKIKIKNPILICITNQAAIAKGFVSKERVNRINNFINTEVQRMASCSFDKFYLCPHHPRSGYKGEVKKLKKRCNCRKPGNRLFRYAIKKFRLEQTKIYNIGDSLIDLKAGIRSGIKENYLLNNNISRNLRYKKNLLYKIKDYKEILKDIN